MLDFQVIVPSRNVTWAEFTICSGARGIGSRHKMARLFTEPPILLLRTVQSAIGNKPAPSTHTSRLSIEQTRFKHDLSHYGGL